MATIKQEEMTTSEKRADMLRRCPCVSCDYCECYSHGIAVCNRAQINGDVVMVPDAQCSGYVWDEVH